MSDMRVWRSLVVKRFGQEDFEDVEVTVETRDTTQPGDEFQSVKTTGRMTWKITTMDPARK